MAKTQGLHRRAQKTLVAAKKHEQHLRKKQRERERELFWAAHRVANISPGPS
jgi:hypothetical protein